MDDIQTPRQGAPAISVIVPVYNVAEYVIDCMVSLASQTFSDFEVLVIDDGSTDGSADIAREVVDADARFRFFEKENGGLSSARNFGIDRARGEYLCFLDSDDYYTLDALERLIATARAGDLDYLDFTAHSFYDTARARRLRNEDYYERRPIIEGIMSGAELFVAYQSHREYHCSACFHFFKRSLLDGASGERGVLGAHAAVDPLDLRMPLRFVEGIIHEDELFSPLLIARAQRAAYLPAALYQRRMREQSIITSARGLGNISSMHEVANRLRTFLESQAGELGAPFEQALAQRIVELRLIAARDALDVDERALREYSQGLPPDERIAFEIEVIQLADQLKLAGETPEQRIGSALMRAPRWVKSRL